MGCDLGGGARLPPHVPQLICGSLGRSRTTMSTPMRFYLISFAGLAVGCAHPASVLCNGSPRPQLAPAISVRAQASQRGLSVLILDRVSNAPVQRAQLVIYSQKLVLVADSNGLAQSPTIAPGHITYVVRALGYTAIRDTVTISEHLGRFLIAQIVSEPYCIDEGGLGPGGRPRLTTQPDVPPH